MYRYISPVTSIWFRPASPGLGFECYRLRAQALAGKHRPTMFKPQRSALRFLASQSERVVASGRLGGPSKAAAVVPPATNTASPRRSKIPVVRQARSYASGLSHSFQSVEYLLSANSAATAAHISDEQGKPLFDKILIANRYRHYISRRNSTR